MQVDLRYSGLWSGLAGLAGLAGLGEEALEMRGGVVI